MGINDHDTFTGLAPLHKAAADGDLEKVIALLDDGADGNIRACGEVRPIKKFIHHRVAGGEEGGIRCDGGRLGIADRGARRGRERDGGER